MIIPARDVPFYTPMQPNHWRRSWLATMAVMALSGAPALEAQVGLSSEVSQVALIARVALHVSMEQPEAARETGRYGAMREMSVKLRVSANSRYRMVVLGSAGATGSGLWVRDTGGEFREVASGSAITVARGGSAAGERMEELRYRSEALEPIQSGHLLPLRYEIRVEPTL